jgi:type I restriction enzyme S subunit
MSATNSHVLGDVASFVRGITFTPEDLRPPFEEGTAVCMRTKNVQVDLDEADLIAVPKEFVRRKEQYLSEGDLLVSSANSWNLVGKCCWVPKLDYEATAGGFISILRADRKKVVPRYLYHWFAASQTQHEVRLCGRQTTNISNLNYERCLNLPIPLPKLEEQKRIAAILDKADAIRRKRQEALAASRAIIRSAFMQMFGEGIGKAIQGRALPGWLSSTINDLKAAGRYSCIGGPFGSDLTGDDYVADEGVPVIRGVNLSDESPYMSEEGFVFVSEAKADDLKKCHAHHGDILVSQRGARLAGQVGLIRHDSGHDTFIVSQSQMKLTPDTTKVAPMYLVFFLQSIWGVRETERRTISTGVPHINLGIFKSLPVYLPPLPMQTEFSHIQSQHEKVMEQQKSALQLSDSLFNSLVQRAFKGEL